MTVKQRSTASYIFESRFLCFTVPDAMVSDEEIKLLGSRTSLDKRVDTQLRTKMQRFYLPISEMARIHNLGYPISVAKQEDTLTIYNYVQNHLLYWIDACVNPANLIKVPRDDLIQLERFAATVYPHAASSPVISVAPSHTGGMFNSRVSQILEELMGSGIRKEAAGETEAKAEGPQIPVRPSLIQELQQLNGIDIKR